MLIPILILILFSLVYTNEQFKVKLKKLYISDFYMYHSMFGIKKDRILYLNCIINLDRANNIIFLN